MLPCEILALTAAYWIILRVFRHTRGIFTMSALIAFCGVISMMNAWLDMPVFSVLANGMLRSMPLIILILFQEEIRRFLAHPLLWMRKFAQLFRVQRDFSRRTEQMRASIDEVVKAVCCLTPLPVWRNYLADNYHLDLEEERLSSANTGALIAIEGITGLENFREAGVELDAQVNYRLLRTIFYSGTALHDGGVILQSGRSGLRITAAGCRFPLALSAGGPVHTRQNAVRGLAERTDAFVLMVSEETGSVLVPDNDDRQRIRRVSTPLELKESLEQFLQAAAERKASAAVSVPPSSPSPSAAKSEEGL